MIQSVSATKKSPIDTLEAALQKDRESLILHPVYSAIRSINDLRWFMENHVFAVWDFMSLLKTLQSRLTCVGSPWRPIGSPTLRRFINEIVLGEESDLDANGQPISHFEMYLAAMREVGANTQPVERLLELISSMPIDEALSQANAPLPARVFVEQTFRVIESGSLSSVAATFTFGREDLIPEMFQSALDTIGSGSPDFAPRFHYYLQRHIDVDGDSHSGLARQMVAEICQSPADWQQAEQAARASLRARQHLWDGVLDGLVKS
jgi:hypothetical protein